MFLLIWVILLFTVENNDASTGAMTQDITAEAGLCVVIPCHFSDQNLNLESAIWYKCEDKGECTESDIIIRLNKTDQHSQSKLAGRVSLLEPVLSQRNCSIVINDLNKSDSGLYQLKVPSGTTNRFTSHRATITVKDLSQKPTLTIPQTTEGRQTTLTCTAPGLCSGPAPQFSWTWRTPGKNVPPPTGIATGITTGITTGIATEIATGQSSTIIFTPSATHHNMEVTCKVTFRNNSTTEKTEILKVNYFMKPKITGKTTVTNGDTLNLTCSVDSFPSFDITWTKHGSDETLNTGSATLVINMVNLNHSGLYTCKGKHLNITVKEDVNITVMKRPLILNSSGCIKDLKTLTCTCISRRDPLPTIKWPLLASYTEFIVITKTSKDTVNSTFILAVNNQSIADVECVSGSENEQVTRKLIIMKEEPKSEGQVILKLLRDFARLDILIAFLIGALLSTVICCLVRKCHRKKHRTHGYLAETLEMVTSQEAPLIHAGQEVENAQAVDQEAPEEGDNVAAGKSDVNYSNLDFSRVKKRTVAEDGKTQETETEYAEIKKGEVEARLDEEGKEEMTGEDEEINEFETDGREDEDVAVYSNVEDIMGQGNESDA